jgi:post-segregation antitoxin (ccd killing protein)
MTSRSENPVDITVYLPDEIGERAKKEDLKLSRMLRDAVIAEFDRKDAVNRLLGETQTYEVELRDAAGREYTGRITGRLLYESLGQRFYLTETGRLLFVVDDRYEEVEGGLDGAASFIAGWAQDYPDQILDACEALGVKPVIDL